MFERMTFLLLTGESVVIIEVRLLLRVHQECKYPRASSATTHARGVRK